MDRELNLCFVNATLSVLKTMAQVEAVAGEPTHMHHNKTWGIVTGVIGLGGDNFSGNLVLSFKKNSSLI